MNNNIQINFTLLNKDFEKIVLFKNVIAVNDLKNKLNLDENSVVQLICIYIIYTLYYKTKNLKNFVFCYYFQTLQKISHTGLKNYVKKY